jgi:hypothetical protein
MTGMRDPRSDCSFNGRSLFVHVPNRHLHRNSNKVNSLALRIARAAASRESRNGMI